MSFESQGEEWHLFTLNSPLLPAELPDHDEPTFLADVARLSIISNLKLCRFSVLTTPNCQDMVNLFLLHYI